MKKAMKRLILGIDPGITGAIALIYPNGKAEVYDMPVMAKVSGKGNQVNAYALADIIFKFVKKYNDIHAFVERVGPMPGQGVTSMFSFGKSVGVIEGILGAYKIRASFPTPQSWKKYHGLIGKEKDYARTRAIHLFPALSDQLKRKKDIGRADALLIATHGA